MSALLPAYENRSVSIVDEVYLSDRNGRDIERIHADMIEPIQPDWDIDRAGSKGRVEVLAHRGILQPNMWIKAYRTVIPEVGDIVRYPLGHWRLGRPGEVYSGFRELDTGAQQNMQNATGSDIVDSIAAVKLRETFYTPPQGNVMRDVHWLIKLATMGVVGPNLLTNHSFENEASGWTTPNWSVGSGTVDWTPSHFSIPDGKKVFSTFIPANAPVGTHVFTSQTVTIPGDAQYMYAVGLAIRNEADSVEIRIQFRDHTGAVIETHFSGSDRSWASRWARRWVFAAVPDGAVSAMVGITIARIRDWPYNTASAWDDLHLGTATRMPLADSRINLPPSNATATTRIQTAVGHNSSIGYHAINADRLTAIGHQALYTTLSGKLTTAPMRTLATATPKRTYGPGDIRLIGDIEVPDMPANIPNHFIAIKESFDEDEETMYAESWNDNPHDAFSTVNSDVVSAEPIYVQDAVDQAALQAVADNARDRHSTQEELHFSIYPDLDLTVYDVIEITDPEMPGAMGKWAIQYIGHDGARMNVSARRAIGGG